MFDRYRKQTPKAYVDAYYSTNTWHEIYASEVMPVTDHSDWRIPPDIESRIMGTPPNPKQAGRSKKRRMPLGISTKQGPSKEATVEEGTTNECPAEESSITEDPVTECPKREAKKCSRCHKSGRYATTCTAFIQWRMAVTY